MKGFRAAVLVVAFVLSATVVPMGGAVGAQDAPPADSDEAVEEEFDWHLPGPDELALPTSEQRPADLSVAEWANPELGRPGLVPGRESVTVPPRGGRMSVGSLPVTIELPRQDAAAPAADVVVEVLPGDVAAVWSPFGVGFTLEFGAVAPTFGESVPVELDYTDVALLAGARAIDRLQLTLRTGCNREKDSVVCAESVELETINDPVARTLRVEIPAELLAELVAVAVPAVVPGDEPGGIEGEDSEGGGDDVVADDSDATTTTTITTTTTSTTSTTSTTTTTLPPDDGSSVTSTTVAMTTTVPVSTTTTVAPLAATEEPAVEDPAYEEPATSGGAEGSGLVLLSLTSSGDDEANNFEAVPLSALGSFEVGTFTGDVSASFPIEVPDLAAGVKPEVVLGYSSGSVDFMVPTTNNQAGSWIGVGWSYSPGSITRMLGPCEGGYSGHSPCIHGEFYSLSLNGVSSRLIQDPSDDDLFHLQDDPYWRIERLTSANGSHPDELGEYWLVRTPDGVTWRFGGEFDPDGGEDLDSAWFTSVYNPGSPTGQQCTTGVQNGFCDRVYQWNLDLVEDPSGNRTVYKYEEELNWFDADGDFRRDYVRAGNVTEIRYGASDEVTHYAVRVLFNTEERCEGTDCDGDHETYPDTPWDLACAASGSCDQDAPTYWTSRRLDSIQVQNKNATSGSWQTVSRWLLVQDYPSSPDVGRTPMRLRWIQQRDAGNGSGLPTTSFETVWLENRANPPQSGDALALPRISQVTTMLGGTVDYTYGQPAGCLAPGGSFADNHTHCFGTNVDGWPVAFNKWVVTKMVRMGKYSGSDNQVFKYEYDTPSWAHDGDPIADLHFHDDFRGHKIVKVDDGLGVTEYRYFQGMHNDPGPDGSGKTATVQTNDGNTWTDWNYKAGRPFEQRRLKVSNGAEMSRTETVYGWVAFTTSLTETDGLSAPRFVAPTKVEEWTGGSKSETVYEEYDGYGNLTETVFKGLTGTGDDSNTLNVYFHTDTASRYVVDRPKSSKLRTGATAGTGTLMSDTRFAYDGGDYTALPTKGLLTKQKSQITAGGAWAETEYTYDSRGRLKNTYDPEENRTLIGYDEVMNRVVWTRTYLDATQYLQSDIAYDAQGRPKLFEDEAGEFTHLEYDDFGRLAAVWLPTESYGGGSDPATMLFDYYPGEAVPYVKTRQRLTGSYLDSYQYVDGLGREIQSQVPFVPPSGATMRTVVSKKYDAQGQLMYQSAPYEWTGAAGNNRPAPDWSTMTSWQRFSYDEALRLEETDQLTTGEVELWDTDVVYTNRTVSTRGPETKIRTDRSYDGKGQLTTVADYNTNTLYATTAYTYDVAGNLKIVAGPEAGSGDNVTMDYDLLGRKVSMTDPDMGNWSYDYDKAGRLTYQKDGKSQELWFSYDGAGHLVEKSDSSGVVAEWDYSTTTGRLASSRAFSAAGTVEVLHESYDPAGRVTQRRTLVPDGAVTRSFKEAYSYDSAGNLTSYTFPSGGGGGLGETVTTSYDTSTGLASSMAGSSTYVADVDYDAAGRVVKMFLGGSGTVANRTFDYDPETQRLVMSRAGKGSVLYDLVKLGYEWTDASNVASVVDYRNGDQKQCFGYDQLDRMTRAYTRSNSACGSADASVGTAPFNVTMTYSESGNINTMVDPVRGISWSYGYSDGPHQVTSAGSGNSYGYDNNGSMSSRTSGGVTRTLSYDTDRRLTKSTIGSTTEAEYLYDADGNRVRVTQGGVSTFYAGDFEWVSQSDFKKTYRLAGTVVAVDDSGALWWMMDDHLGSLGVQYQVSGDEVRRQRYDPWGLIRHTQGLATDLGYTGQRLDDTGLMFYQARYYDPVIGRFTTADTIVPDPAYSQDFNRYSYVRNNPLRYTDPTGHASCGGRGACRSAYTRNPDDPNHDINGDPLLTAVTGELELISQFGQQVTVPVTIVRAGAGHNAPYLVINRKTGEIITELPGQNQYRDFFGRGGRSFWWHERSPKALQGLDPTDVARTAKFMGMVGDVAEIGFVFWSAYSAFANARAEGVSGWEALDVAVTVGVDQSLDLVGGLIGGYTFGVVGFVTCGPLCAFAFGAGGAWATAWLFGATADAFEDLSYQLVYE